MRSESNRHARVRTPRSVTISNILHLRRRATRMVKREELIFLLGLGLSTLKQQNDTTVLTSRLCPYIQLESMLVGNP